MKLARLLGLLLVLAAPALAEPVVDANPIAIVGTLVEGEITYTRVGGSPFSPLSCTIDEVRLAPVQLDLIGLGPGDLVRARGAFVEVALDAGQPTVVLEAYAPDNCMPGLRLTAVSLASRAIWLQREASTT